MILCDRCGKDAVVSHMSYFNTQIICVDCETKERAHPLFETARRAERAACKAGNYNFPGIGKPEDL